MHTTNQLSTVRRRNLVCFCILRASSSLMHCSKKKKDTRQNVSLRQEWNLSWWANCHLGELTSFLAPPPLSCYFLSFPLYRSYSLLFSVLPYPTLPCFSFILTRTITLIFILSLLPLSLNNTNTHSHSLSTRSIFIFHLTSI